MSVETNKAAARFGWEEIWNRKKVWGGCIELTFFARSRSLETYRSPLEFRGLKGSRGGFRLRAPAALKRAGKCH